jgi:hypothetical protein
MLIADIANAALREDLFDAPAEILVQDELIATAVTPELSA